ncbi:MAG: preprotein translocase subunit SecE, partial [Gaiellaceae bacterium]
PSEREREREREPERERERAPEQQRPRSERRPERESRGIPGVRFVQESVAELKKVEWPDQHAVVSGTAVVLVACVIVGAYLWANDEVWKYVVQHVLLR